MTTVRTPAEQQSIYRFMLKSLQEYPSEAISYLNFEVSRFDDNEELQQGYQRLSKTNRQKLYDFFNNKSSSTRFNSRTQDAHYCKKPSNACRRFATEPRSITPKSSIQYPKQIQQPLSSPDPFFTQTSGLIHSWKLKQRSKNQLGIELNALIGGCTKLSQLIEIIHSLNNDKLVMETSWNIRLIHKLLHKAAEFSDSRSSNFDGVFNDITRFKSSYEAKTCILLLKLIKLNLNFSDGKRLVLGNAAEASLMLQWGIKPNVAIYNAFITVCAKTGQFDSAWHLVCGDKPVMAPHLLLKANQITCMNLLTACAETERYAEAKSLVLADDNGDTDTASLMQQWGIKPDVAVYSAFIKVCAKTGQFDSAWLLVCGDKPVMAPHLPLKADSITCLNLLAACAEAGHYAEAKSLVLGDDDTDTASLIQQWGIKPNVAVYSAFITVCAKTGQFDSAWQLVCGNKPVMAPHLPLKVDSITCTNLLTACAESRRYAEAKSLVLGDGNTATDSLMEQWDIKPNVAIYNAFITVCAKTGQFDNAWQLVCGDKPVMAPHWSLKADQITCMNLLAACAENGRYAEAKSLVLGDSDTASLMQQWGIKPNVAIYNAFITVCAKTGQFDSAWRLTCGNKPVMAPHLSLKANLITCMNLLAACAEAERYAEAKSLVLGDTAKATASLMQQWGIKPDVAIYNSFITVCAKTGQLDSAWQLVCGDEPIMAPHWPLKANQITCINLLTACAETGRYTEAKSLVLGDGDTTTASLMQQWGIKPDIAIYSAFITVCAKTGQFDSAWQLVCG
ncbi:hypothetical protein L2734_13075, partial [Parashewanella spongiae]